MNLNRQDIWAHLAPMFHLVDVFAVYAITMVGGRHVILPSFSALDALLLIEQEQVTVVNMASTMVAMLVNNPLIETLDLRSLRVLSCGGSPQAPAVIIRAISVFGCEFFVSYGMTECCGKISMSILPENMNNLDPQEQLDLVCTSGRPFSMVDVRVVDDSGSDVPKDGVTVGEVWVRGETVFGGYRNLTEANKESFSDGWFKTGDLAAVSPNNYLTVVDRKKDMLLVGGENVYTTEVEEVLTAHPAIHHAAVFGIPHELMGDLVAAAVTIVPGLSTPPTKEAIRTWCHEHLAEYKVPVEVLFLDKLPTTATGKPLKKELQSMMISRQTKEIASSRQEGLSFSQGLVDALTGYVELYSSENMEGFEKYGREIVSNMTYLIVAQDEDILSALAEQSLESLSHAVIFLALPSDRKLTPTLQENINKISLQLDSVLVFQTPEAWWKENQNIYLKAMLAIVQDTMPPIAGLIQLPKIPVSSGIEDVVHDSIFIQKSIEGALKDFLREGEAMEAAKMGQLPLMEAGLTSTSAVQFVSFVEKTLGMDLPGTLVFDYPTIPDIIAFVEQEKMASFTQSTPPKTPGPQVRRVTWSAEITPTPERMQRGIRVDNVLNLVLTAVQGIAAKDEISAETPLMEAGMTSTSLVQLVSELESVFKTSLPGTLAFDYPTPAAIADFVRDEVLGEESTIQSPKASRNLTFFEAANEIGLMIITSTAHNVPGGTLTKLIVQGNDRVGSVPLERWDVDMPAPDNSKELNMQFGSFLQDADQFDPRAFLITPAEAIIMDPQQRLALLCFSEALCGQAQSQGNRDSMGIFVGVSQLDYASIVLSTGSASNSYYATGSHLSVTAGRLSYTFGFSGPAAAIDTACSSSLVTMHMSVNAIETGDCSIAGSVGVNLCLVHSWTRACLRAGMLADDGRCKTFDASADGYVRSEAVSSAIIQLFRERIESVHGVAIISGTAVNEDGRSSSLTAPNGPAQQEVVRHALLKGGLSGANYSYLQMHGTGTSLGDPIELGAALAIMFGDKNDENLETRKSYLNLTSAKSTLGHAEPAAGGVGLLNLFLSLRSMEADPLLHLRTLNPYISSTISNATSRKIGNIPSVPRQSAPLPLPRQVNELIGGVSSFAFQGTNAHATIRSRPEAEFIETENLVSLSAKGMQFQKERLWILPPAHPLSSAGQVTGTTRNLTIRIEGRLQKPRLSNLHDIEVKKSKTFPQSVPVEAAIAGISTIQASNARDGDVSLLVVECIFKAFAKHSYGDNSMINYSCNVLSGLIHVSVDQDGKHLDLLSCYALGNKLQAGVIGSPEIQAKFVKQSKYFALDKEESKGMIANISQNSDNGFKINPGLIEASLQVASNTGPKMLNTIAAFSTVDLQGQSIDFSQEQLVCSSNTGDQVSKISCLHNLGWFELSDVYLESIDVALSRLDQALAFRTSPVPLTGSEVPVPSHPFVSLSSLQESVRSVVYEALTNIIGYEMASHEGFMASGLDSLGASELVHALSQRLDLELPETLTFDYPNPEALIDFLASEVYAKRQKDEKELTSSERMANNVENAVVSSLFQVLGHEIEMDQPLLEAGLDSLGATELVSILAEQLSLELPGTLIFDYPTANALSKFLMESISKQFGPIGGDHGSAREIQIRASVSQITAFVPITGYAEALMQGDERSSYDALKEADRIVHIPLSRWDVDYAPEMAGDKSTQAINFGAHLRDIDMFDANSFGLSSTEATVVDPQARILLQLCGDILLSGDLVKDSSVGVFIGMTWTDYIQLATQAKLPVSVYTAQGAVLGVTPGRISYHYGLKGPSIAMETACSSALVATNSAWQSIQKQGGSALAGGINLLINAATTYNTVKAGMLTMDGRCKALDASADGYVRSESCSVIYIGGEYKYQTSVPTIALLSAAVNQDGRSSALTAPNGPAQQNVIRQALELAAENPHRVGGIALHGTGTTLGDPIEIGSACAILLNAGSSSSTERNIVFQASKTKIGHAEPASGMTSLLYLRSVRSIPLNWFNSYFLQLMNI